MSFTGEPFKVAAEEMAPKVDAFVAPLDPVYAVENWRPAKEVVRVFMEHKKPIFSMVDVTCQLGAVVSVGPSVERMTRRGSDMVQRMLKGEKPGNIPIVHNMPHEVCVNPQVARYLGLRLPFNLAKIARRVELPPDSSLHGLINKAGDGSTGR